MVNLKDKQPSQTSGGSSSIPPLSRDVLKRLEFTLSHLLLPANKTMVVTAVGSGQLAYEYAQMRPYLNVIGIDRHRDNIDRAKKFYTRDNLTFIEDGLDTLVEKGIQVDAFLNIGSLHQLYSRTSYNAARVLENVKKQLSILPIGGQIIIQDFFTPPNDDRIVFLEVPKRGDSADEMAMPSASERLQEFSQMARPLDTSGGQGFLLEEQDANRAGTRLFRLPYKWAVEFLYRAHDHARWAQNLEQEYTIFSLDQWHDHINDLGARMTYCAPYYRDDLNVNDEYALYNETGAAFEMPPRGFICVVEKVKSTDPLYIQERRSALSEKVKLSVETEEGDDASQTIHLVKRHQLTDDLLPWRTDGEGNILVTVRINVPRPIINAAARGVPNLDGKKWAGFFVEPIVMPVEVSLDDQHKTAVAVLKDLVNLDETAIKNIRREAQYYPKPEFLVQRLRGFTVRLHGVQDAIIDSQSGDTSPYRNINAGYCVELYASDILKAVHVGLVPDSRLEILIMQLMRRVGLSNDGMDIIDDDWNDFIDQETPMEELLDEDMIDAIEEDRNGYMTADQVNNAVKHVRSVFVKQGNIGGLLTGIESVEEEFVLPLSTTTNTVVCFPLSVDSTTGLKVVGVEPRKMPVPGRMDDRAAMVQLPSFQLSNDVKTLHQLHEFLAEKFDCKLKDVKPMGSSFFACSEISPERVYPFAIFNPGKGSKILLKNAPIDIIQTLGNNIKPHSKSSGVVLFKGMRSLGEWYQGGLDHELKMGAHDMLQRKAPEITSPVPPKPEASYEPK